MFPYGSGTLDMVLHGALLRPSGPAGGGRSARPVPRSLHPRRPQGLFTCCFSARTARRMLQNGGIQLTCPSIAPSRCCGAIWRQRRPTLPSSRLFQKQRGVPHGLSGDISRDGTPGPPGPAILPEFVGPASLAVCEGETSRSRAAAPTTTQKLGEKLGSILPYPMKLPCRPSPARPRRTCARGLQTPVLTSLPLLPHAQILGSCSPLRRVNQVLHQDATRAFDPWTVGGMPWGK